MTMMNTQNSTDRIYNFSAGPSTLPVSVLEQAREDILNIQGTGIGVLEHSHRGATITEVFTETLDLCREMSMRSSFFPEAEATMRRCLP
jgi:phosphoserine aminotransferase